ncbi:MAG TPA: FmdB family zinc ribbon protein, partial [Gammaproteobacteria bacterium]|nr:FmdB family zinc ribbon protein [Gammaproteobacteria bacterium]
MPIYEYKCSECGHFMDALQGVNDSPLEVCPECSEKSLKRLISAPNFRLSGEGWYETDFKTENRKNIAENGKSETKKKESDQQ